MKKFLSVVLPSLLLVIALISCNISISDGRTDHDIYGVEEFSASRFNNGSKEICYNMLPNSFINEEKTFQKVYDYLDGKFGYFYSGDLCYPNFEKAFVYIVYDAENYELAKKCCLTAGEMYLSEEAIEEFNGYVFYVNYRNDDPEYFEESGCYRTDMPHFFSRFAYNDEKNTLIFLSYAMYGFSGGDETINALEEQAQNDWSAFLAENFGMWYSFDE